MVTRRRLFIAALVTTAGIGVAALAAGGGLAPPGGPPGTNQGPAGSGANPPRETGPVVVTTEAVSTGPVQRTVAVVGSLYGREEVSVSVKVEGAVRRVHHDVGDEVRPGDPLVELDPTDADLAVAEAQKGLELDLAKLGLKEPPPDTFDIATLPAVVRAAAKERYTTGRYERARKTSSAGSGSADDLDQTEFDYRDAVAASRQAKIDAETTLAAVRQRQAALETARQRLKDGRVRVPSPSAYTPGGPVTYLVAQRNVSEGEMVRAGSAAVFRLVIADALKLQAAVPERHLGEVKVGERVQIAVEAHPGEKFPGTVARVNPTVDRSSRTFQIEIAVPNAGRRLAPGSFARAEVLTRLDPGAVLVPEDALVTFAGVTKVFVVRDGKAVAVAVRPTDVRVGAGTPGRTRFLAEVAGGVRPGDRVATGGQAKLTDGAAVRERDEPAKGGQP